MDVVDELVGTERRRGMRLTAGRTVRARGLYRGKVEVKVEVESGHRTRFGYEEPSRSMWTECRECGARRWVPSTNRGELIRAVDAGEVRCTECGGRMVEG